MNVNGEYQLHAEPEKVWQLLLDPDVLGSCIPGGQELRLVGPDEYEASVKIGVPAVQGEYKGKVRILDKNPPSSFRLEVEGRGRLGTINAIGHLELAGTAETTVVTYRGEYQVAGLIATVGQRLFEPVAQMLTSQFFGCVESKLSQSSRLGSSTC
jgi:carbon monoxide dehydrogenase subunit G